MDTPVDEYKLKYDALSERLQADLDRRVRANEAEIQTIKSNYLSREAIEGMVKAEKADRLSAEKEFEKRMTAVERRMWMAVGVVGAASFGAELYKIFHP